jgi:hypothetical protein
MKNKQDLINLKPVLAQKAQEVYDSWSEDWCMSEEVGHGGICHLIADAFLSELYKQGFDEAVSVSSDHEVHVWVALKLEEGVFLLDLPYNIYERGGGYNWTKISGIIFSPEDLVIDRLSSDPEEFKNYLY